MSDVSFWVIPTIKSFNLWVKNGYLIHLQELFSLQAQLPLDHTLDNQQFINEVNVKDKS